MMVIIVKVLGMLILVVRTRCYQEGEAKEMHLFYHPYDRTKVTSEYPWVVSFMDIFDYSVMCTASVVLAHMSLTTCDCLVTMTESNATKESNSFHLSPRIPGDRYVVVGGVVYRKYEEGVEELETREFIVHELCKFNPTFQLWFSNFGLIVHEPFRKMTFLSGPMPTWSSQPEKMELHYQELISTGAPCYLIGWLKNERRQVKITVMVDYEPLNMVAETNYTDECTRVSCLMYDLKGPERCMQTAVSCTSNRSIIPYNVESGMPLVCGVTGEVYAISTSTDPFFVENKTDFVQALYTPLWKLSWAVDWIKNVTVAELAKRSDASQYNDEINDTSSRVHSSQPASWAHSLLRLLSMEIVKMAAIFVS